MKKRSWGNMRWRKKKEWRNERKEKGEKSKKGWTKGWKEKVNKEKVMIENKEKCWKKTSETKRDGTETKNEDFFGWILSGFKWRERRINTTNQK